MVSPEDIRKLALLSRIKIEESEEEKLAHDMEGILTYIGQLDEVKVDTKIGDQSGLKNVMRDDANPHSTGLHTENLIEESPESEKGFVVVKKIL